MATIRLKGPGLNDWFAEQMVKDHGPEEALNRSAGPMRKAVERVIENLGLHVDQSNVEVNDDYPLGYMQGRGAA